jgi:hypothetical protein
MGAAMMGLPNYESQGDVDIEERYGEGAMDALHRGEPPQELLEHMERGLVGGPRRVALMMKDAVESDPTTRINYRGMVVTDRSPILNLIEGDTFKLPPSSFSPSAEVAEQFQLAGMYEPTEMMMAIDDAAVFGFTWVNVRFDLVPGAKVSASGAVLPSGYSPDPGVQIPFEVIANGEFEVLRKEVDFEGLRVPSRTSTLMSSLCWLTRGRRAEHVGTRTSPVASVRRLANSEQCCQARQSQPKRPRQVGQGTGRQKNDSPVVE